MKMKNRKEEKEEKKKSNKIKYFET